MNRGRSRQKIFHSAEYFDAFLKTVEVAHTRFGVQVLSYCLMSNHYLLLVKTPEANLGRAMRHINGVYTQRYNRLKKTDSWLFREYLGLKRIGSISNTIAKLRALIEEDKKLARTVAKIKSGYDT